MNAPLPARRRGWPRVLALLATAVVLLALAAATFTLSYNGIHVIALGAGVPPRLARAYPGLLDAALVIACLAAVMLRDGRWWARGYAWLAIIVIVAVGGATDTLHAMNVTLPHRQTAGGVAAAPWVLLLLAFSLWLTALRQPRSRSRSRVRHVAPEPTTPLDALLIDTTVMGAASRGLSEFTAPEITEPRITEPLATAPEMAAPQPPYPVPDAAPAAPLAPVASPAPAAPPAPAVTAAPALTPALAGVAVPTATTMPTAVTPAAEPDDAAAPPAAHEALAKEELPTGEAAAAAEQEPAEEMSAAEQEQALEEAAAEVQEPAEQQITAGQEAAAERGVASERQIVAAQEAVEAGQELGASQETTAAGGPAAEESDAAEPDGAFEDNDVIEEVDAGEASDGNEEATPEESVAPEETALPEEAVTASEPGAAEAEEAEEAEEAGTVDEPGSAAATMPAQDESLPADTVLAGGEGADEDATPSDAKPSTLASSRPRDYWDDDEDVPDETYPVLSAPTESDATLGGVAAEDGEAAQDDEPGAEERGTPRPHGALPTEVRHSLDEIAAQAPPLPVPSTPRFNRLRSASVPSGEDTETIKGDAL
jgi:uncharacterized protein DUF2637